MSVTPSYDDVNLILRLYELRREPKLREARDWFGANFKGIKSVEDINRVAPMGTPENAYVRMVTSYWDMVASFVTSGVLNAELFYQSGGELVFTWLRIEDVTPELRRTYGDSQMNSNMEQVANQCLQWIDSKTPGAAESWRKMAKS
jgi:hypothetical protein